MAAKIWYQWGGKVPFHSAVPGKDFHGLDCSGFSRECVYLATGGDIDLPDGSVNQHAAIKAAGLKLSTFDAGTLHDGAVRIAFLEPVYESGSLKEAGHVLLILDGTTYESHGTMGVGNRVWGQYPWMTRMSLYVLTAPVN